MKSFIQALWLDQLSWDDPLNQNLSQQYQNLRQHLQSIEEVQIPRCVLHKNAPLREKHLQLHVFCDASTTAYAATVYIQPISQGLFRCQLQNLSQQYQNLRQHLQSIEEVQIPRCVLHKNAPLREKHLQLHVFCDASTTAYAATVYIQPISQGLFRCQLQNLSQQYQNLRQHLQSIEEVQIPRCVLHKNAPLREKHLQLHVFCDASTTAYAATVYIQPISQGLFRCQLLVAKTRVAPIKTICVPRLELCAALLGAQLVQSISNALEDERFSTLDVFAWTDSTVT